VTNITAKTALLHNISQLMHDVTMMRLQVARRDWLQPEYFIYNFIRHISSHIQYKKAMYSKQNDEKVNNSVTIFQQCIRVGHIILAE